MPVHPGDVVPAAAGPVRQVSGVDQLGQPIVLDGEGLLARCIQHEVDHLNGRRFVDRLPGSARKQAMRELRERYAS